MCKDPTLDATLKWFSIFAIPMLVASWYRMKETGWNSPIIIHFATVILVWCLYFFRKKVSFRILTLVLLSLVCFIGGTGI